MSGPWRAQRNLGKPWWGSYTRWDRGFFQQRKCESPKNALHIKILNLMGWRREEICGFVVPVQVLLTRSCLGKDSLGKVSLRQLDKTSQGYRKALWFRGAHTFQLSHKEVLFLTRRSLPGKTSRHQGEESKYFLLKFGNRITQDWKTCREVPSVLVDDYVLQINAQP